MTPTAHEYRALLREALPSAVDADTAMPDLRTLFTPDEHRLAIDPDATIVRGARGAGKTVWFHSLQDPVLRGVAADAYRLPRLRAAVPLAGYGSELRPDSYPGPGALSNLIEIDTAPELIWTTVLLLSLGVPELRALRSWTDRVRWVREHPDARDRSMAEADQRAGAVGEQYLMLFDALDRMHADRRMTDHLVAGILKLALDLRTRTRNLRAKVFIRDDMLREPVLRFPDSSKLVANAVELEWSPTNLYGLLFHLLGNSGDPSSAAFREQTPRWVAVDQRYSPPPDVRGDGERQRAIFVEIAGWYMGTNHRKGLTYTWLPNHLMDGVSQVSPRSFLSALYKAAELTATRFAGHEYALHWEGIRRGVQAASEIRVREITEDLPWVAKAIDELRGMQVPVDQNVVVDRWRDGGLASQLSEPTRPDEGDVRTGPRHADDYRSLIDELIDVGVMTRRKDGRLDLPDVYRIAFGVGRRGGVPRVRQ